MSCLVDIYAPTTVYLRTRKATANVYTGLGNYNTAVTTTARVDEQTRMIKSSAGRPIESFALVVFSADETTGDGMQVSLDNSVWYDVLKLVTTRDLDGNITHYEAYI